MDIICILALVSANAVLLALLKGQIEEMADSRETSEAELNEMIFNAERSKKASLRLSVLFAVMGIVSVATKGAAGHLPIPLKALTVMEIVSGLGFAWAVFDIAVQAGTLHIVKSVRKKR